MTFGKRKQHLIEQFEQNFQQLELSLESLEYSYNKCQSFDLQKKLSPEQLEALEALTARFARSADILTQKVFKSLFLLLQEEQATFLDAASFVEKLEIVEKADDLLMIRELRNCISHEYSVQELNEVFENTLKNIPLLQAVIARTQAFFKEKFH
jgi:hypothetical protein